MNRTDRLYAIVEELRAIAPRPRSARWLAGRFEVSARTVERDIAALQQSGCRSRPSPAGPAATAWTGADAAAVNLTPGEAVAMAAALRQLDGTPFRVGRRGRRCASWWRRCRRATRPPPRSWPSASTCSASPARRRRRPDAAAGRGRAAAPAGAADRLRRPGRDGHRAGHRAAWLRRLARRPLVPDGLVPALATGCGPSGPTGSPA